MFDFELTQFLLCDLWEKFLEHLIYKKGQWLYTRIQNEYCEVGWARRHGLLQGGKYEFHGSYTSMNMFVLNARMLYGTTENAKQVF